MPAEGPRGTEGAQLPDLPGTRWVHGLLSPAVAAAALGFAIVRGLAAAIIALPRIATALENLTGLDPTLRELSQLRGTIERIEQLGTFVATEVPESLHQLEAIRGQLGVVSARLADLNQAMLNLTLTPRELDRVRRELVETMAPLEELANRLETLSKTTPIQRRPPQQRSS